MISALSAYQKFYVLEKNYWKVSEESLVSVRHEIDLREWEGEGLAEWHVQCNPLLITIAALKLKPADTGLKRGVNWWGVMLSLGWCSGRQLQLV